LAQLRAPVLSRPWCSFVAPGIVTNGFPLKCKDPVRRHPRSALL